MNKTLTCVMERMEEKELYQTVAWNSICSLFLMLGIGFFAFFVAPVLLGASGQVPIETAISWWITYFVLAYVFRIWEGAGWGERLWNLVKWSIITFLYFICLLIGGEMVGYALMVVGIIVVIVFLSGQVAFTGIFTYRDLKNWVKEMKKVEERKAKQVET